MLYLISLIYIQLKKDVEHSDWHMDGLIVRIKDSYPHDSDFRRAEGIIRSIHVS